MKKLLSLLSVLTISGTAVPTIIAASPYQKEETIKRNKRSIENTNNKKNYFNDINGTFIYHYNQKYFYDSFNLTDLYGYSDWSKFKQDFSFFEISDVNVEFYRHDNIENKNKNNLSIKWDFRKLKEEYPGTRLYEFDYNIENDSDSHDIAYPVGDQGYPVQNTNDIAFGTWDNELFNEKITYKATYHHGKINYALQKYIKNNKLMLRIIYKFWLDTAGSTVGADLKLSTKGYKFY
ncbi:MAG: hypothetical protein OHM56_12375 [Spiroplasma phoeniceum]|nr:MAG: hypothetical protein OHM57_11810 [Spiroplasma phoeniceum]UZQ32306.1 MAG: hypothetical protein OHM56_12375 [Spiroplasma phoeniceum]